MDQPPSPGYETLERSESLVLDMYRNQVSLDEWAFGLGNRGQEEVMPRTSIQRKALLLSSAQLDTVPMHCYETASLKTFPNPRN